jgi:hypothetical protein
MTATLGYYNPAFYANEALIFLKNRLGLAKTVHMGFDEERRSFNKGDVINIRRPGTFTAAAEPSTAVDIAAESIQVTMDQHYGVKFKLTDKDFAYTGDRVIREHIAPAVNAIAQKVEADGFAQYKNIGNYYDVAGGASSTAVAADIINIRKTLFDAKCPMDDIGALSLAIDSGAEAAFLGLAAFTQWQGSSDRGVASQVTGTLGGRYGFGTIWSSQNIPTHTKGTNTDTSLFINNAAGYSAGTTTIALDNGGAAITDSVTLVAGDVLTIAHGGTVGTRNYAVTATATEASDGFASVSITPGLAAAVADNDAVTARMDDHSANLAYHRDAFCLAFAKLPDFSQTDLFGSGQLGANIMSVQDPDTGIAIRSRIYYVGNSSEIHVALDVLYGWKTLNPLLAARLCG